MKYRNLQDDDSSLQRWYSNSQLRNIFKSTTAAAAQECMHDVDKYYGFGTVANMATTSAELGQNGPHHLSPKQRQQINLFGATHVP